MNRAKCPSGSQSMQRRRQQGLIQVVGSKALAHSHIPRPERRTLKTFSERKCSRKNCLYKAEALRQKTRTSLESALEKGAANLNATLPPAAQSFATILGAQFKDAGAGRLAVVLVGEIRIPTGQVEQVPGQIKQRAASR